MVGEGAVVELGFDGEDATVVDVIPRAVLTNLVVDIFVKRPDTSAPVVRRIRRERVVLIGAGGDGGAQAGLTVDETLPIDAVGADLDPRIQAKLTGATRHVDLGGEGSAGARGDTTREVQDLVEDDLKRLGQVIAKRTSPRHIRSLKSIVLAQNEGGRYTIDRWICSVHQVERERWVCERPRGDLWNDAVATRSARPPQPCELRSVRVTRSWDVIPPCG